MKLLETEINKQERSVDLIDELLAKRLDKEANLKYLNEEILKLCKTEEIKKEIEKQQEYKDNITWKVRANRILKTKESEVVRETERTNVVETRSEQQNTVKLPRLQIPQYDGNILRFHEFYYQFEVAIHKNVNLSNVEKFSYLKSYLTDEAEVALRGLALSSENYEIVLNILKERFGRKDIIIDAHTARLLNLSPVRKSYDIIALRRLYSECETHIRGLENNGINPNSYSCLLVYMWTDSLIALHWIKGKASKWKPFVSNRVSEIQSRTDPADWNHCSGQDNPADFISRGATVEKFMSSSIWMQGPEWLRLKKRDWPKGSNYEICLEISPEVYCEKRIGYYDLYTTLNLKLNDVCELSTEELNEAEIIWTKTVQSEAFAEELSSLRQGKTISKTSSILELNPFLNNDGIMHVGGRLQKSRLSYLQRHPIIMPSKHHFVNLLVWDAHSKVFHGGISETLIEIRERYWIIKGRQTVKNILRKCILCKRFNSSPGVQVTAPLPVNRTEELPPFSVVGIDFGGPLYTKDSDEKNYIVLFTCGVTRALHLEFVGSMTTETFLLAFRRFIARRGLCSQVLTDNAKTFKRSELELKNMWTAISHPTVKDFYASHKIQWCYIAEKAAWWGGFYERLIKSVKLALRKTLRKTTLSRYELETLINY
ncbi:uncharacterized protein LOC118181004 [Stegodyphus dumicola]|uniref:uncharacterized protein LOC118181004 n=1 Tax=Stegodyphus dumicola TaxID=202533 RepID=UPI0015B27C24|nr:uncharacterized protein LOC118181004 [Stegodyphus dumicola]